MEQTEIALLKAEIARLNKLITILIEQNEAQKEQIALANITNGNTEIGSAAANITKGNPEVLLALAKITKGNTEADIASVNFTKGNAETPLALTKVTNGNPEVSSALAKISNGNTNVLNPLSAILTPDSNNITRLRHVLKREGFNKVRKSGVKNAAMLLLHFYHNGRGDYKELRKLTGHSNFGMAKYIRSLKKRGLIERDGWQKFKLTAHAVGLIQKAGCTS